jgi:hypothetical protein
MPHLITTRHCGLKGFVVSCMALLGLERLMLTLLEPGVGGS